jgi:hypothetical protein
MNVKKKIYLYANSKTQRCPKEIMTIFLIEDFFHFPPVSTTPVLHLELRISPQIELEEKFYLYANSKTQRCPKEIMTIFLIEDFFSFSTCVNDTSVAP